jgi:hypothetical protein
MTVSSKMGPTIAWLRRPCCPLWVKHRESCIGVARGLPQRAL